MVDKLATLDYPVGTSKVAKAIGVSSVYVRSICRRLNVGTLITDRCRMLTREDAETVAGEIVKNQKVGNRTRR